VYKPQTVQLKSKFISSKQSEVLTYKVGNELQASVLPSERVVVKITKNFSSSKDPDRPPDPTCLLFSGYLGVLTPDVRGWSDKFST
jgi:hypothetical protein